jgi:hypothetical protein
MPLTPYQQFVCSGLVGIAHTAQTTKAAWNRALDALEEAAQVKWPSSIMVEDLKALINELKEP